MNSSEKELEQRRKFNDDLVKAGLIEKTPSIADYIKPPMTPKQKLIEKLQEEKFGEWETEVSSRARGHNEGIGRCLELIEEILP